jgi:hypothetical protein
MDKIRSRKYTYEIIKPSSDTIQTIKNMSCIYHAIVFDKRRNGSVDYMRGFIYFKNPIRFASVNKLLEKSKTKNYNVSVSQDRPYDIHNELQENDDVWEYGSPPIQGGSKSTIIQQEEPSHGLHEEPSHGLHEEPSHGLHEEPSHGLHEEPSHGLHEEPSHGLHEEPSHGLREEPSHGLHEEPSHGLHEEPSHGLHEEPSHGLHEEPSQEPSQLTSFEQQLLRLFEQSMIQVQQYQQQSQQYQQQTQVLTTVLKDLTEKVNIGTTNNITNNTMNNTTNNTMNNTINVFLNEDCNNAITFAKLLEDIRFTEADILDTPKYGLEHVITMRILHEIQQYDITKRPVHCTDIRREVLHVKQEDGWKKETGNDSTQVTTAARVVYRKGNACLVEFIDGHPDLFDVTNKGYDKGLEIMCAMNGGSRTIEAISKSVQKNIAKEVYINTKMIEEFKNEAIGM